MAKLDASHSRQKGPDLDGKASVGAEVMALFSASKACCSAAPHDQFFDFWVSVSQLAMGGVTCHTCHGCVTHFRPILGNIVEVTLMTSPFMYIVSHAKGTSFP